MVGLFYVVQVQLHTQLSAIVTFTAVHAYIACRLWEMVIFDLTLSIEMKMLLIALVIDRIVTGISHQKIHVLYLF